MLPSLSNSRVGAKIKGDQDVAMLCKGINIREALVCSLAVSSRLQGVNEGSEGSQANSQVVTL